MNQEKLGWVALHNRAVMFLCTAALKFLLPVKWWSPSWADAGGELAVKSSSLPFTSAPTQPSLQISLDLSLAPAALYQHGTASQANLD